MCDPPDAGLKSGWCVTHNRQARTQLSISRVHCGPRCLLTLTRLFVDLNLFILTFCLEMDNRDVFREALKAQLVWKDGAFYLWNVMAGNHHLEQTRVEIRNQVDTGHGH